MEQEFIDRCAVTAADLVLSYIDASGTDTKPLAVTAFRVALYLAGQPEDAIQAALDRTQEGLRARLARDFGADGAALMAETFAESVLRIVAEMEANYASRGAVIVRRLGFSNPT